MTIFKFVDEKIKEQYDEIYKSNESLFKNRLKSMGYGEADIDVYIEYLSCREMYTIQSYRYDKAKIDYETELSELKYSDKLKNFKTLTAKEEQAKVMLKDKRMSLNKIKLYRNRFNDYKEFLKRIIKGRVSL